jgi:hypothetical protein
MWSQYHRATPFSDKLLMNGRCNPKETGQEVTARPASPITTRTIQFGDEVSEHDGPTRALYIPPPWKRDRGKSKPG